MKSPAFRRRYRSRKHRQDERGVTIILVALSMVGILAMAALSIDVVTFYLARLEAQRAADAGALSAARIISLSGVTGDPGNSSGGWPTACTLATQVAQAVASQDTVSGTVASTVTVTFQYNGTSVDCSSPSSGFAVNPQVQVQVQRTSLPTFFARLWGAGSNNVTASATAEAYNPSGSGGLLSTIVPVQPRCVKPWLVPNQDPLNSTGCTSGACNNFVNPTTGSIQHQGISLDGSGATGAIGETFTLFPDCHSFYSYCNLRDSTPIANRTGGGGPIPSTPNLEYLPAATAYESTAVPSCSASTHLYEHAIEGCDQTTVYACGVQNANTADLSENPGVYTRDTAHGVECLIHENGGAGQDTINSTVIPFQITAGDRNPLAAVNGDLVSSSTSIVSLPIYDSGPPGGSSGPVFTSGGTTTVTIVGFLQVFIINTDPGGFGTVQATVLNVAGCGNGTGGSTGTAVTGSSPVPVRLITPP